MRCGIRLASMLLIASLFALSCSSIPTPTSSDDCLIIIKTEFINKTTFPVMRKYRVVLSGTGESYQVPTIRSSYLAFVISEPAVKIVSITSSVQDVSAYGLDSKGSTNIDLPYKPGSAVVADFCISQVMDKGDSENSFVSGMNLRKAEQFEKDELMMELRDSGKIEGWAD